LCRLDDIRLGEPSFEGVGDDVVVAEGAEEEAPDVFLGLNDPSRSLLTASIAAVAVIVGGCEMSPGLCAPRTFLPPLD